MKVTGILILTLTYYANAYIIEKIGVPMTTVLEMEPCGSPAIIDYGYSTLDGYIPNYGYTVLDTSLTNYETSICQRPFSSILDMGVAYPLPGPDYIFRECEIPCPRSACLAVSDFATIPPLPPVIGCPKYLRQITIPPPFL